MVPLATAVGLPDSNGYILVEANGGLNQQRSTVCFHFVSTFNHNTPREMKTYNSGWHEVKRQRLFPIADISVAGLQICNAVAVAKLMNATLIVPHFHFNTVWKDPRYALLDLTEY